MKIEDDLTDKFYLYFFIVVIAVMGNLVRYLETIKDNDGKAFFSWKSFLIFIYDCIISGFLAILVGLFLSSTEIPNTIILGISGIVGHLGTRGWWLVQRIFIGYIKKLFPFISEQELKENMQVNNEKED